MLTLAVQALGEWLHINFLSFFYKMKIIVVPSWGCVSYQRRWYSRGLRTGLAHFRYWENVSSLTMTHSSGLQDTHFWYLIHSHSHLLLFLQTSFSPSAWVPAFWTSARGWSLLTTIHKFNCAVDFLLFVAEQNTWENWKTGRNKLTLCFQNRYISSVGMKIIHQHWTEILKF